MNNPLRSFIAIELNEKFHSTIAELEQYLKTFNADVKWVKPQNAHLTLKFLGDVPAKNIDVVKDFLSTSLKNISPFSIELTTLGAFVRRGIPQVIWIGLGGDIERIKRIVEILEEGLGQQGFKKERREFSAHITLGRVRSSKNCAGLTTALQNYPVPVGIRQDVTHVTLFKSNLTPQGPIYEPLGKVELK